MSKPVMITTDSTSDMNPALAERFGIGVVPLHVVLGEESYLDGVEFTPEMIYEHYAKDGMLPHTAAVTPQEFLAFFGPMVEAGYEVVFLSISSELSGTYQNAVIAAQELPGIYPVDSRQLTSGMCQMLFKACAMRDAGMEASAIAKAMVEMIPKVNTSFVIDTLEYMWKGGRCSGVTAFGANLLKIKPAIEMRGGKLEVCKKYRGAIAKVYDKYIEERLSGKSIDPDYIFITTSNDLTPEHQEHISQLVHSLTDVKEIFFTRDGCTVTAHCGPGTLGILFLEA